MNDVLTDLSTPALVHAIKDNLLEFFRYLKYAPQTDFYADGKLARWHTRVPHPWFNGVSVAQPASPGDERIIQETIAYFRSRGVSAFTWWVEPSLSVRTWENPLKPIGFHYDNDTPGMAVDLHALREDLSSPSTLKILPVEDLDSLKLWTHVFIAGYGLPAAWEKDFLDLMAGLGIDLPMRNYLGYLDGEPVATSNLFLGAGVAGIQCVATLPQARGRGIGAALTLAPLREAREMNYRIGILQSSDLGFKVYQRLGFQKLCDMEHFYWTDEDSSA